METRTFPSGYLRLNTLQSVKGELVAGDGALEHRSEDHATLRMEPVRQVALTEVVSDIKGGRMLHVKVVFGENGDQEATFFDLRSKIRPRASTEQLASELEQAFGFKPAAIANETKRRQAVKAERRELLPAGRLTLPATSRLMIGHLLHAEERQVEYNKVEVREHCLTFQVELPRPRRGVGRSAVTCPVCSQALTVSVPSGARLRTLEIRVISALVAIPVLCLVVLAATGFKLEGVPFVVCVLAVVAEVLLVGLLVWVIDKDGIRVRGAKHKRLG